MKNCTFSSECAWFVSLSLPPGKGETDLWLVSSPKSLAPWVTRSSGIVLTVALENLE
jgi:hypothetical protein